MNKNITFLKQLMPIILPVMSIYAIQVTVTHAAQSIANNLSGLYDKNKVPSTVEPTFCIQNATTGLYTKWEYGQTLIPTAYSGNQNYYGGAVRIGGCQNSDIYMGWLDNGGYQPNSGAHIVVKNAVASLTELSGNIGYKVIGPSNLDPNPRDDTKWMTGINLSGLEFSTMPNDSVIPNLSVEDSVKKDQTPNPNSDLQATKQFLSEGANTVRLPIRWAYVQPELKVDAQGNVTAGTDSFDAGYFDDLVIPTLSSLTSKKYNVILDLHSYMHYSLVGTQIAGCDGSPSRKCPDGTLVNNAAPYVNIWAKMLTEIRKQPSGTIDETHLMVDIVNEPSNDPGSTALSAQNVFDMEIAVVKKLQSMNFKGLYLLEGVQWSGLHSWEENHNDQVFTRDALVKAGFTEDVIDRIIINVHQYLDSNFSGNEDVCQQDLTTTGQNGFNLDAFIAYLQANKLKAMVTEFGVGNNEVSCSKPLKTFLDYMKRNAYKEGAGGFVGWTTWSTGHGWGSYNLRIIPGDWKDNIIKDYYKLKQ